MAKSSVARIAACSFVFRISRETSVMGIIISYFPVRDKLRLSIAARLGFAPAYVIVSASDNAGGTDRRAKREAFLSRVLIEETLL